MGRRRSPRWGWTAALAATFAAGAAVNWLFGWSLWRLYCALLNYALWGS